MERAAQQQRRASAAGGGGHTLVACGCVAAWMGLSAGVIMLNKYILAAELGGFPFPLALTTAHMAFCAALSWLLVRARLVAVQDMPIETYLRCVVPVGVLFSATLWSGNAAYMYLSVSFIQMLKAAMPMLVYVVGTLLGTEQWCAATGRTLLVVAAGVLLASHGELVFVAAGVAAQCCSLVAEALRLTLVQLLLQQRGFKLHPVATMYFVSPVCLMALLVPFAMLEAEQVFTHAWRVGPGLLLGSAAAAFGLNCAVFLLIDRTSALTLNVAGVVKDVGLIYLSVALFGSVVSRTQVAGYAIALCGVCLYNYRRLSRSRQQQEQQQQQQQPTCQTVDMVVTVQLLGGADGGGKPDGAARHTAGSAAKQPAALRHVAADAGGSAGVAQRGLGHGAR